MSETLFYLDLALSCVFVVLPFAARLWSGWRNRVFMLGLIILFLGKIGEGIPDLNWWQHVYVCGDPLILAGSLLLFSRLGGSFINEARNVDRKMIGALFCGSSILFTVMLGMAYTIIGSGNNYYVLASLVYFIAWLTVALSYLEMSNYHPLAFIGAFFAILSIIICFSHDGPFWAGTITEAEYDAAPWIHMYTFQNLGGIFGILGMFAAKTYHRVSLPAQDTTRNEKMLIAAILIAVGIIITVLMTDPAVWG